MKPEEPQPSSPFGGLPRNRWLGRAIQASAAVGIVVSVICIVLLPILALRVASWIDGVLMTVSAESDLAAASMQQVALALDEGAHTLRAAQASLRKVHESMLETEPLITSTAELVGEQAPVIITDTRNALTSAEQGAAAIDQVLRTLAVLGPITGVTYSPERPLDEGLSEVAESLEPLPSALRQVGEELGTAASSLVRIGGSFEEVGEELGNYAQDISGKSAVLADLAGDLDTLSSDADNARGKIGPLVLVISTVLELLLAGQALGQSAIFHVGRSMCL